MLDPASLHPYPAVKRVLQLWSFKNFWARSNWLLLYASHPAPAEIK